MFEKSRVKLILLMTAVNLVFSCLVTNCPRGGKRGSADLRIASNNIIDSRVKLCKLCNPVTEICLGVNCPWEASCGVNGYWVTQEVCYSKRLRKLRRSCESDFQLRRRKNLKRRSIILTKILK